MANTKTAYSISLKFDSIGKLNKFLSQHLPFGCEIVDHSKPKTRRGKAAKNAKTTRPQIPSV